VIARKAFHLVAKELRPGGAIRDTAFR
jgi:hypothetical protein